jgi:hypothetical protein
MAINSGQTFTDPTDANTSIDSILTQEANRIGSDIHRRTMHVSPWMDLIKQTAFPDGMGYKLGTMIYDRALPVTEQNGTVLATSSAASWKEVGGNEAENSDFSPSGPVNTQSSVDQLISGARDTFIGAGNNTANGKSFIHFARQLKQYSLKRATVESPKINVEDLRFAAYRTEQLRAVMDALTESTRFTWEERYRDEYDRICGNIVKCVATGTVITSTGKENLATGGAAGVTAGIYDFGGASDLPTANASNKILDSIYFRLVRSGAGTNAYGRENARPVFGLVCSSELSYALQTEAGFRDDVRYNQSKVSDLIAPLGVEKAFRGFYHLIDDLAPRFIAAAAANGTLTRVYPYTVDGTTKAIIVNTGYDTASYEAAYVLHQDVMESQIPEPITGSNGLTFDPVNYRGKFAWKNIPSVDINPDGTIGFFRGVLASASKPIKTDFGFVVIFKRDSLTPAA